MNEKIVGYEFNLTIKYAVALNTIFVTFFYCSGKFNNNFLILILLKIIC